jgi:hypothetical protein
MIYEALGMPVVVLHVMLAIGRTSSWIAQWLEMVADPEQKIARPLQIYTGPGEDSISLLEDRGSFASACATNDPPAARSTPPRPGTSPTPGDAGVGASASRCFAARPQQHWARRRRALPH